MDKNSPLTLTADELNELCYIKDNVILHIALVSLNGIFFNILNGKQRNAIGEIRYLVTLLETKGMNVRSPEFYSDHQHYSSVIRSLHERFPELIT